ncbi:MULTISPECIES: hypothetical protein [Streptomyces]|uniref:Lipoprotein n=1 Tax=Streptomyces flavochromogenes TaxID=68199 RepID=A0ABW6Y3Q6_9ACTN
MRPALLAVVLAALAVVLTAGCGPDYAAGPTGRVTDREATYRKHYGWKYTLTVRGETFRVERDAYRKCFTGSAYPSCTTRTDR